MKDQYLLDASALLALLFNEPGAEQVWNILDKCQIHAVNLAEAAKKIVLSGMAPSEMTVRLSNLRLEAIETFDTEAGLAVGHLAQEAKRLGLALGDLVCLVTAERIGAVAVTVDRRWSEVKGLRVQVLRIR